MYELLTVPGPEKRPPRVACCIVTRSGREKYLERTLAGLRKCDVDTMLWSNGPIDRKFADGHVYFHEHPFNAGQHAAHNAMIDECVSRGVTWHIRVDDDCWMRTRKWLPRMLRIQDEVFKETGRYAVISPRIDGLDSPPPTINATRFRRENIERVDILGGIFRMSHMGIMRYFRFDERLPMGGGDATLFSEYCKQIGTNMLRMSEVVATHGDSTRAQNKANPLWSYEHDMLQYIPLGL